MGLVLQAPSALTVVACITDRDLALLPGEISDTTASHGTDQRASSLGAHDRRLNTKHRTSMHAYYYLYAKMAGLVACPECHGPAHALERFTLESTDGPLEHGPLEHEHGPLEHGPLEHVKVRCNGGHWFTLPADRVVAYGALYGDRAA
jgi:hypothetical protein